MRSDPGSERSRRPRRPRRRRRSSGRREGERKERVLHTRISEQLAEDIRDMAEELRIPVSNLVRNVLEEAFAVVEQVSGNVGDLVEEVVEEAERVRDQLVSRRERRRRRERGPEPDDAPAREDTSSALAEDTFPDVVGWQPLLLHRRRPCSGCGEALRPGEQAWVGVGESGLTSHSLCADCLEDLR